MSEKTHYEVMGLQPGCSPDEVKKRFRELARQYHPDRHPEFPHYHEIFVRITQAYEVLNDSTRRARYDLDLRDKARRDAARASQYGTRPGAAPTSRPSTAGGARANGGPPPGGASAQNRARRDADQRRQVVARLLDDARNAYSRGHLGEAQRLCTEVLRIQRIGPAYELLGDIYQRQGRLEEAVQAYTIAAQMVSNSGLVMAKLNRVAGRLKTEQRDYRMPQSPHAQSSNAMGYKMAVGSFGLALVVFLIVWGSGLAGSGRAEVVLGTWTFTHLILLAATGFLSGAILAAGAWIRPIDQELFFVTVGGPRRSLPVGLLLTVVGALFFPLVVGVYLIIARLQEAISGSVLVLLAAVILVTLGFVLASDKTLVQTLLFGGNVVWLASLCGWFIGDLFRPSWA